ncbi:hypothetical protein BAUCODRAFT_345134 [Baudoinia panamericana UAMH 10762]|uniref:Uncharacterized protein n=1 Tax=Baudoinia panamericana (strain UAMH 10762) TaxID=717646 RepID=M2NKK6_BAUPA|nr:uncharacterized protein BAUCODRAFT_345134 [Baudoinia panamericana UAMH 10762]EMC99665.1 hypothetical protein BAUCODRAFT_345134 [Baudoinia panamericana UAMH 10762]
MRVRSDDDLFSEDFTPVAQSVLEQPQLMPFRSKREGPRGRRNAGGRARAEGTYSVRGQHNDVAGSAAGPANGNTESLPRAAPPENAPTGPRKDTVGAVRGDRHATGGLRKPKLTEDELAEKMARITLRNEELSAAHARAEADAASFAEREAQAKHVSAQRQREERRDRQQMMGERERNRMRKLKAMEGREWDAEKREDDFQRGGRFDKAGGFAGDTQDYSDGREYSYREPRGGQSSRAGRRVGDVAARAQTAPQKEDFPALLAAPKTPAVAKDASASAQATLSTSGDVASWADQVESSTT